MEAVHRFIITRKDKSEHVVTLDMVDWLTLQFGSFRIVPHEQLLYVKIRLNGMDEYLHRRILNAPIDKQVDHRDNNGLNNCRYNLREATNAENCQNKSITHGASGVRSVYWNERRQKWQVQIKLNQKKHNLGYFDDIAIAAEVVREFRANNMPFSQEAMFLGPVKVSTGNR